MLERWRLHSPEGGVLLLKDKTQNDVPIAFADSSHAKHPTCKAIIFKRIPWDLDGHEFEVANPIRSNSIRTLVWGGECREASYFLRPSLSQGSAK